MKKDWTYKKLGELTKIKTGKLDANASSEDGIYPFFTCSREPLRISSYSYDCECVLVAGNGELNVKYYSGKFDAYQRTYIIEALPDSGIMTYYMYHFFNQYVETLRQKSIGGIIKYIKLGDLTNALIPIPPLSIQRSIVSELDLLHSVIEKKQEQLRALDNLAQSLFYQMFGDPITNPMGWEIKKLGEVCGIVNGKNQKSVENPNGKYVICGSGGIMGRANDYICPENSVIIGRKGNINRPILMREKYWNVDTAFGLVPNTDSLLVDYLYIFTKEYDFEQLNVAVTIPSLRKTDIAEIDFPLPPLSLQQSFATKVSAIEEQKQAITQSIKDVESLLAQRMDHYFG